ncbi:DUF3575 domain-containing protein [Polaribacter batillariae]|uniref:DUF3575 domain-containing protein n=1 Tax=Polaribacter batillariae TaxID=2808900 RepID=A0ABX7SV54_9FLAO|nr:DUF3575 domain-containing protein [Polaribacter batillariae]QTD36856.1 DUF3575 domain-containing protein [Polaribacter batillariae]
MKKLLLIFGLLASAIGYSQQEVKLDIADALVMRSLEFSYENYINTENSFGVSALFNLAKQDIDFRYNENTMITPFFRHYFTSEAQWNFFGEAFLGINSGKAEVEVSGNTQLQKYTDGALGVAIGTKYTSKGGLVIDVYAGLGRNLFGSESPLLVPRAGVNVGWRF